MKKLLVKPGKLIEAEKLLKLLSGSDIDIVDVFIDDKSDYISNNIKYLNELLKKDENNDDFSFEEEYKKIGLEIIENNNGKEVLYSDRLIEVCKSYLLMILPKDESDINEFVLLSSYIFSKEYEDIEDLYNIMPDLVSILINNDVAYIGE